MSEIGVRRETAFDPYGEPIDLPRVCLEANGYRDTRRAALVFWALALLIVAGRIYLSEAAPSQDVMAQSAPAAVQVSVLR